tara:strand:- start:10 stop:573 length:564 start_codon:yes stop_codon:yes gene_type:complete
MAQKKYAIVGVPGSASRFVGCIFDLYINGYKEFTPMQTGSMHLATLSRNIEPTHKVDGYADYCRILIAYDEDDIETIIRMDFNKAVTMWWPSVYKAIAGDDWPEYSVDLLNDEKIKQDILNLKRNSARDWIKNADRSKFDFIIDFKTIMSGNINQQIAEFLNKSIELAIGNFVQRYQECNKKIYGNS